jgi:ABC-type Fe2+-enterobactin transport system substrate-binding protein
LLAHGREEEAEAIVRQIEAQIEKRAGKLPPAERTTRYATGPGVTLSAVARTLVIDYRQRSLVALALNGSAGVFL